MAGDLFPLRPPRNQVALVLDGAIWPAPAFQAANFRGDIQISGNFTKAAAHDLATIISAGSLGVQLQVVSVAVVRH